VAASSISCVRYRKVTATPFKSIAAPARPRQQVYHRPARGPTYRRAGGFGNDFAGLSRTGVMGNAAQGKHGGPTQHLAAASNRHSHAILTARSASGRPNPTLMTSIGGKHGYKLRGNAHPRADHAARGQRSPSPPMMCGRHCGLDAWRLEQELRCRERWNNNPLTGNQEWLGNTIQTSVSLPNDQRDTRPVLLSQLSSARGVHGCRK
jgi:hypothetical protein